MIIVRKKNGESTDSLIRRFQKIVAAEGFLNEARDRMAYKKPAKLRQEAIKEKRKKIKLYKKYDKQ